MHTVLEGAVRTLCSLLNTHLLVRFFLESRYDEGLKVRKYGLSELDARLYGTHHLGTLAEVVCEGRTLTVEPHVFNIGGGFTRLTSVNPTPQSVSRPTCRTKHLDF